MSSIITTQDLTDYMAPKTLRPGLAQTMVDSINAYVERETGRCWGETQQVTERYDWKNTVWLRHQDVISVDRVRVGIPGQTQSVISVGSYHCNEFGRLTLYWPFYGGAPSRFGRDYIEVTYTYGVGDVPEDLRLAALGVAATFTNWAADGNKDVTARSIGTYSVSYRGKASALGGDSASGDTASANFAVIRSYATRRL